MLFLKITITKQNKLSKIGKRRIVAYLLQVIVSKFEGQGLKIAQFFKTFFLDVKIYAHAPQLVCHAP